jgi:hypothetical protein
LYVDTPRLVDISGTLAPLPQFRSLRVRCRAILGTPSRQCSRLPRRRVRCDQKGERASHWLH